VAEDRTGWAGDLSEHPDLVGLLEEAWSHTGDPRGIFCRPSLSYGSHVEIVDGIRLGGAHSPLVLSGSHPSDPVTLRIPLGLAVSRPRVLVAEPIESATDGWVAVLEWLAEARESLVIVTAAVQSQALLETLIVNTAGRSAVACPVLPPQGPGSDPARLAALVGERSERASGVEAARASGAPPVGAAGLLRAGETVTPELLSSLPAAELALIGRWTSCLLFPRSRSRSGGQGSAAADRVAVVHVGGRALADQDRRLSALAEALDELRATPAPAPATSSTASSESASRTSRMSS
jgi:hypothetical protein